MRHAAAPDGRRAARRLLLRFADCSMLEPRAAGRNRQFRGESTHDSIAGQRPAAHDALMAGEALTAAQFPLLLALDDGRMLLALRPSTRPRRSPRRLRFRHARGARHGRSTRGYYSD